MDLQTAQIIAAIAVAVVGILGTIFGWFGKLFHWIEGFFRQSSALLEIPKRTLVLVPEHRPNAFWWHMGSMADQPAMQIVGDMIITNISVYGIYTIAAKLKRPRTMGHVLVRDLESQYSGRYIIPTGGTTELRFDFLVMPPVKKEGQSFKADVAIIDQFGNEHWIKGIEFKYM